MTNLHDKNAWTFGPADPDAWEAVSGRLPFTNLLQSAAYGDARARGGWRVRRFLLHDETGIVRGLAQFIVRSVPLLGGVARMNRGPLLDVDVLGGTVHESLDAVASALKRLARERRWWLLQVAPEWPAGELATQHLHTQGFRQLPAVPWGSVRIDLANDETALLTRLNGKWRNLLRKSWRFEQQVAHYTGNDGFTLLLPRYRQLQQAKDFTGVPEPILSGLASAGALDVYASHPSPDAEPSGLIAIARHADTATYLIGWTSDEGRRLQSNYLLLWHAILEMRDRNCNWFDLGGLTEATPRGIAHFKRGLNGEAYQLAGEWRLTAFGHFSR